MDFLAGLHFPDNEGSCLACAYHHYLRRGVFFPGAVHSVHSPLKYLKADTAAYGCPCHQDKPQKIIASGHPLPGYQYTCGLGQSGNDADQNHLQHLPGSGRSPHDGVQAAAIK